MFLDSLENLEDIARKSDFCIFVLPDNTPVNLSASLEISPEKDKITIDKIREIIDFCKVKQKKDTIILIKSAEKMNEHAENAFLKLLEEPPLNYHFIFITSNPSALLPTLLSRGEFYLLRVKNALDKPLNCDETIKFYARSLVSARSADLPAITKTIFTDPLYKKKDYSRTFILAITSAAIEILYKSYFKTSDPIYLKKLPNFLKLHENLKQNGNIKLHLVADLC